VPLGRITWFHDGTQVVRLLPLLDLKDQELFPVVSWGGTSYCITLGVAPPLPVVDVDPTFNVPAGGEESVDSP
jgi:hypothetical protein